MKDKIVMTLRGILAMPVTSVVALALVSCHGTDPEFTVGGSVSGSTVSVVVKLNGENDISMSGNGNFKFDKHLLKGDTFNVQIVDANDQCNVANGSGTVDKSNITDVSITCVAQASQTPQLAIIRTAILNGANENQTPPLTTKATGVGGIVVFPSTTLPMPITGGITVAGLTPLGNQVAIFLAPSGNPAGDGSVLIPLVLAADGLTAVVPPNTTIPPQVLGPLLRGELYFNVGTAANQNGEIRGSIQLQGGVAVSVTALDQAQVKPPTSSSAKGAGTLLADRATGAVLISYITHTVTGTTVASLNSTSGVVGILFPNQSSNIDGGGTNLANPASTTVLTPQALSDFDNNLLFYNVTSTAFPGGEIRGNISPLPQ